MAQIKKGDTVRQILPDPIVGVVSEFHVCQETGLVSVTVESDNDLDGDGVKDSRVFLVDQVERV